MIITVALVIAIIIIITIYSSSSSSCPSSYPRYRHHHVVMMVIMMNTMMIVMMTLMMMMTMTLTMAVMMAMVVMMMTMTLFSAAGQTVAKQSRSSGNSRDRRGIGRRNLRAARGCVNEGATARQHNELEWKSELLQPIALFHPWFLLLQPLHAPGTPCVSWW